MSAPRTFPLAYRGRTFVRTLAVVGAVAASVLANATLVFPRLSFLTPPWGTYAGNPQHTGISHYASAALEQILWSDDIDPNNPQGAGGELLVHYGSPVVSRKNTVVYPYVTNTATSYSFRGRDGATGSLVWQFDSDYVLPPSDWTPVVEGTMVLSNSYAMPGIGGSVYFRQNVDSPSSAVKQLFFYGEANHTAYQAWADANVKICTPLMGDGRGNIYFGYYVGSSTDETQYDGGAPPAGFPDLGRGGIALVNTKGKGTFVKSTDATGDSTCLFTAMNCAPAESNDGASIYIAVVRDYFYSVYPETGYLLKLNALTLATEAKAAPINPVSGYDDGIISETSGTPTVGPDGDVYWGTFGLYYADYRESHGWMHHYDADLNEKGPGGCFGWDDTSTLVPSSCVASYTGTSSYLLLTKFNNYKYTDFPAPWSSDTGADGQNMIALEDPNDSSGVDRQSGHSCMNPVLTVLGITPDDPTVPGSVKEWCINSAAIDPTNNCAIINSEDGHCYTWDFASNTLQPVSGGNTGIYLNAATGEAYTPTVIGPDGTVYAINAHKLYAISHL